MTAVDIMITEKPYPLKCIILTAANPILTNPNSTKVKKAFENLELLVVHDLFMTQTAQCADYIIPAASFMERTELFVHDIFQTINLTKKVISFPDCSDEYQFWHDLAVRLGAGDYYPWKDETELNRWLLEPTGITLEELYARPEGIPYKPITYNKWQKTPFSTPSGKVEFVSQYLENMGYDRLPVYKSPQYLRNPDVKYPYVLTTGARSVLYYHSRYREIPRFRTAIPEPEMEMHPKDCKELGIIDGDRVKVTSCKGEINIKVKTVSENAIVPGVVHILHGWNEADANALTIDDVNDPVSGFPLSKSVPVNIKKYNSQ